MFKLWEHVRKGSRYVEIGRGLVQASTAPLVEDDEIVLYRSMSVNQTIWARETSEFEDGRFKLLGQQQFYDNGTEVVKNKGYAFHGWIVSGFWTIAGKIRYVVDNGDGMLHIFNGDQLDRVIPQSPAPAQLAIGKNP